MTLSELIILYRREHNLSQRKFAELSGLSNGYISMLEKAKNPNTDLPIIPTLPQLKKISNVMNLSLTELLSKIEDIKVYVGDDKENASETNSTLSAELNELIEVAKDLPPEKIKTLIEVARGMQNT